MRNARDRLDPHDAPMKTPALHARLTMWLGALLTAMALILVIAIARVSERYRAETTQRLNAGVAMYVTGELALIDANGVNRTALHELAHRAMTVNPSVEVYLLSPDGEVIATPVARERLERRRVDLQPIRRFLTGDWHGPLYGDDPTSTAMRSVFSVAEIRTQGDLSGYLYTVLGSERFVSVAAAVRGNYSLQIALLIVAALLTLTLAIGALLFRRLTLPLRQLKSRMQSWSRRMGIGGLQPETWDADEIAALDAQFELLSGRIAAQVDEIAAHDAQRRELIACVSHDLRTPLTALHGYLETVLLKGERLDDAVRNQYLVTAHRHAMQLERLIAALFELSKLEAGLVTPNPQCFSLAELLHDVALRFRLRAEQAQVRLEASTDPNDPPVHADIALIERALANLIDNALRYTPPGGSISISSRREGAAMRVRVADTGSGMIVPVDKRRVDKPSSTSSSGLGLAIVKRIVQLHGFELDIDSAPQCGTRIEFGLSTADDDWERNSTPDAVTVTLTGAKPDRIRPAAKSAVQSVR